MVPVKCFVASDKRTSQWFAGCGDLFFGRFFGGVDSGIMERPFQRRVGACAYSTQAGFGTILSSRKLSVLQVIWQPCEQYSLFRT